MRMTIFPSKAEGTVTAPPSKSVSHRALICGALTKGCCIKNCGVSQDIEATLSCLKTLGATVEKRTDSVYIGGLDPFRIPDGILLDCGESGSTLRFLLPLCLLSGKTVVFKGHGRLMKRPMEVYETFCREQGFFYEMGENTLSVRGRINAGAYTMPGNVSSQFITGLLFALSCVSGNSRIEVTGKFESSPYVDVTQAVFETFGRTVSRSHNTFSVCGGLPFTCREYVVEGDCSNAAFLDGFNLLGGSVKVLGLSPETPQGDRVYQDMFAAFSMSERNFDLSDCPDLGPIMFALSAALGGAKFSGTERLRLKESDRISAMAQELKKFGINVSVEPDGITVMPGQLRTPTDTLWGHEDHRVVMALSLLCSVVGGVIDGAEAVQKSFPQYFDILQSLGILMKGE